MEHDIFFDGNVKEYSWSIKTNDKVADQIRAVSYTHLTLPTKRIV